MTLVLNLQTIPACCTISSMLHHRRIIFHDIQPQTTTVSLEQNGQWTVARCTEEHLTVCQSDRYIEPGKRFVLMSIVTLFAIILYRPKVQLRARRKLLEASEYLDGTTFRQLLKFGFRYFKKTRKSGNCEYIAPCAPPPVAPIA